MPTTIPTVALDIRGEIFFSRPARGRSEAHRYSCRRSIRQRRLTIYSIVSHLTDAASKIIYRPKSPANGALVLEKLARHPLHRVGPQELNREISVRVLLKDRL